MQSLKSKTHYIILAAEYGVCLTEDNAKELLALLKQDGWLK